MQISYTCSVCHKSLRKNSGVDHTECKKKWKPHKASKTSAKRLERSISTLPEICK